MCSLVSQKQISAKRQGKKDVRCRKLDDGLDRDFEW
jgi:hypothetical protein